MSYHPKTDEIARLAGGALMPRLAARVGLHVENCARCRKTRARIAVVEQALAAARYPPMSDSLAAEIELAIAIEISHRNFLKSRRRKHAAGHERSHGLARPAGGFAQFGHVAWAYRDNDELAAGVVEYAEDGIAAGQYVELVGLGGVADLERQFSHVASSRTVRQALESGQAALCDVADFYLLAGEVVDAEESVARRIATLDRARAAGFNGSRIVTECTAVTGTPDQRDAFAQYEHLLDRLILQQPIAAFCAYDARALRISAVAELACMHPYVSARATPFQLYAEQNAALGLAGTLSDGSVPLLSMALGRAGKPRGSELTIDARSADYICGPAFSALSAHAQQMNVTAVLRVSGSRTESLGLQYPALTIEVALSPLSGGRSQAWRFSRALLIAWPAIRPHPG